MTGAAVWASNSSGLHDFDTATAICRRCGVALLDASGFCEPGGQPAQGDAPPASGELTAG